MSTRASPSPRFSYKSDRLKPLRAFCQTVRLGSVSRAAEALFVSQPAISLQLQALERELGVPLFERSGRRLVPSREGQLLYEMAQPLVENLDGLEARFRDKVRGLDAGELNIAANSSTILYLLPKIVERFRLHHPDVRLTLHNAISADGTDLLREDAADLAIGSMTDVPADLSYAPAYRFEQVLIAPHDHPLASGAELELADIARYPLVLPPKRQITYRLVDQVFQRHRIAYTVALEVGGLGSDQAVRGDGHGHFHRAGAVPERGRPRAAGGAIDEALVPRAQLRGDRAPGQGVVGAGAGVHRADPAGVVQSARLRPERAFRAVGVHLW